MIITYAMMSMIDLIQTLYGLSIGLTESNPFMQPFVEELIFLSAIKILGTLFVVMIMVWMNKRFSDWKVLKLIFGFVVFIQTLAVVTNMIMIIGG